MIVLVLFAGLASTSRALAWGATGHRIISRLALEALPGELPAFLRTPETVRAVGELAREPDRWKAAGRVHDSDRDAAHFLDLDDTGAVLGGPALNALPATREDYETALRAVGTDSWKAGYLPYAIVEGWQQLAKDFAYWRVDRAAERTAKDPSRRDWLAADRAQREALILRDLGTFAHYVGDGSQPLHVSVHFNGWGAFPNPRSFTQNRLHAPFEGAFVRDNVSPRSVRAAMSPPAIPRGAIMDQTIAFLAVTHGEVTTLYALYAAAAFEPGDPRGVAFATARLAAGAAQLRDMTTGAWRASAALDVGYPAVRVSDVEAGLIDPYPSLLGVD